MDAAAAQQCLTAIHAQAKASPLEPADAEPHFGRIDHLAIGLEGHAAPIEIRGLIAPQPGIGNRELLEFALASRDYRSRRILDAHAGRSPCARHLHLNASRIG